MRNLNIENLVKSAKKYVDSVVVCDDGSTDNTANIAKKAGAVVISHKTNKGYGAAIIFFLIMQEKIMQKL